MSAVGDKGYIGVAGLQRPYTLGSFQKKLNEFEELIKDLTYQDMEATPEERRQMITENLRFDQFCDSIKALFGSDVTNQDLKAVYRKISTNPDAKVDWSELFGFVSNEEDQDLTSVTEEVNVFTVSARRHVGEAAGDRKRRDTVQCIKYIPSLDSYLTASQKGALSVWSSKLRLQACVEINESAWVTGAAYLPNIRRVAACTERSISIWDNRAKGKNQHIFSIKPIGHSPQCMTWVPHATGHHEDTIIFGDDQGYINILTIAGKDLTMKNAKPDKKYSQNFVIDPAKLSYPIHRRKLHDDWVLKLKYFPELRCFGSCSPSGSSSFVLEEIERVFDNGDVRGVSIHKGVNAFDYCARANIIATGGVDKVIRVWHPHIFSRPTGKLIGHLFTIVEITCNEKDQHIISLSTARVFRIWDIHTLTCLQVFTDNEERPGEKRIYSMIFDNKYDRLLTGSSVIDAWPLTRAIQDTMQVPHTHDRPITQILYNKELNQIVTMCSETVVKVWDTETGKMVYNIPEPHGPNVELTCLAIDKSGYRLATGAFDGSVKVWDSGSGQEIKWRLGRTTDTEDHSILAMAYSSVNTDTRCIVALGWNNRLKILLDSNEGHDLPIMREFDDVYYVPKPMPMSAREDTFTKQTPLPAIGKSASSTDIFRKERLLTTHEPICCDVLQSSGLLATGCNNGNVIMWDIDKSIVDKVFQIPGENEPLSTSRSRTRKKQNNEHRVNCAQFLEHKVRRPDPEFIKKLTQKQQKSKEEAEVGTTDRQFHSRTSRATSRSHVQSTAPRIDSVDHANAGDVTNRSEAGDAVVPPVDSPDKEKALQDQTKTSDTPAAPSALSGRLTKTEKGDREKTAKSQKTARIVDSVMGKDEDPDSMMIVDTYDPVLLTCHQDSFIRFWTPEGELLREITAITRRQGSAVTAVCHDQDCNIMVTGDQNGYLTLWNIAKFLENQDSEKSEMIEQVICWRGHLTRVTQLVYLDSQKATVSGSVDGSVRVWWGTKGRFLGFFGQHRPLAFPSSEETAGPLTLPYDITEGPLAPVKSARQKVRTGKNYEYPLIFDNLRWKPFRRSAYHKERFMKKEPEDKKFFEALIKPKPYNVHLESFTGEVKTGTVFSSLPVYRVRTPSKPKTPEFSFPMPEEEENSFLFGAQNQGRKTHPFAKKRKIKHWRSLFHAIQGAKTLGKNSKDFEKERKKKTSRGNLLGSSSPLNVHVGSPRRR